MTRNYYIGKNKLRELIFLMAATKVSHKGKKEEHAAPLKGTWISVTVVGVVIVATYIVLYSLYMTRI
jgi:heme/copper-type cytochrome/quinol oxidase subunit 2